MAVGVQQMHSWCEKRNSVTNDWCEALTPRDFRKIAIFGLMEGQVRTILLIFIGLALYLSKYEVLYVCTHG